MKKQSFTVPLGVGISSMVAIFITLTLTTLGALGLQTAYTYRQSVNKQVVYMKDYYKADNKGEIIIKEMHQLIENVTYANLIDAIRENEILKGYEILDREKDKKLSVAYKIPLNDKQQLHIILELTEEDMEENKIHCEITKWQVITDSKKMGWE